MKSIYAAALLSLLMSRSISLGEDPRRADVDSHPNESLRPRTLRVAPPTILPLVRMSAANPHNRGLTTIGGPATKSKNAAVIDGTGMKRR
jgi:hypothetical protein